MLIDFKGIEMRRHDKNVVSVCLVLETGEKIQVIHAQGKVVEMYAGRGAIRGALRECGLEARCFPSPEQES